MYGLKKYQPMQTFNQPHPQPHLLWKLHLPFQFVFSLGILLKTRNTQKAAKRKSLSRKMNLKKCLIGQKIY